MFILVHASATDPMKLNQARQKDTSNHGTGRGYINTKVALLTSTNCVNPVISNPDTISRLGPGGYSAREEEHGRSDYACYMHFEVVKSL